MRIDAHTVRCHLVNELLETPHVKEVWHDGSDVVILDFTTGESVAIHLVERYMSVDEIQYLFSEDAQNKHYTMLILWSDMFMPSDGQVYAPDDWMVALLQLYGGKIYAYDAWREAPHIFNVRFSRLPDSHKYIIAHGDDVTISRINVDTIETTLPLFNGFWHIARFDGRGVQDDSAYWDSLPPETDHGRLSVRYYFNLLGIKPSANRDEIKQAYRELARKHHPDVNLAQDTTQRMQQINDAYNRLLRYLDSEEGSAQTPPSASA